jgi:hypothetical protein
MKKRSEKERIDDALAGEHDPDFDVEIPDYLREFAEEKVEPSERDARVETEPPFRYGDDYPWNPDLDHEETLEIMRKLGLVPCRAWLSALRRGKGSAATT